MKKSSLNAIVILCLACSGCTTPQSPQKSNLTPGMAKTRIVKGETSQNDILEVFGPPNIITKNKSGNEVWTYDKVSIDTSSSGAYGTLIVIGAASESGSVSTRTFILMIEFGENDIVEDYSYRSSAF